MGTASVISCAFGNGWPRFRRFGAGVRNRDGSTAVEFALLAAPFFGLVLLIMQVALYHFSLQSLDFATRQAGRMVMTGSVSTAITSAGQFKGQLICPKVFWALTCDNLVVNAYRVGSSSDAAASTGVYARINAQTKRLNAPVTSASQQSFCLGGPGDYVFIDVAYQYPNYVRRLLSTLAPDTHLMRSTTFVFNEPYKTASARGSC